MPTVTSSWDLEASLSSTFMAYKQHNILEMTGSVGPSPHMFLRFFKESNKKQGQKVFYNGRDFHASCGFKCAGYDDNGQLVYRS